MRRIYEKLLLAEHVTMDGVERVCEGYYKKINYASKFVAYTSKPYEVEGDFVEFKDCIVIDSGGADFVDYLSVPVSRIQDIRTVLGNIS